MSDSSIGLLGKGPTAELYSSRTMPKQVGGRGSLRGVRGGRQKWLGPVAAGARLALRRKGTLPRRREVAGADIFMQTKGREIGRS